MERIITPARMRELEQAYIQSGAVTGLELMEKAAQGVADTLATLTPGGALFLCGPGNNGGDGYAAARLYAAKGRPAHIWTLSDPARLTGDARVNHLRCLALRLPITPFPSPATPPPGVTILVDALFGTGLDRPLAGPYADAVHFLNASPLPVLAIDIPSGAPALMVRADATVTFHRRKPAHLLFPGRTHTGPTTVLDIGLPDPGHPADYEHLTTPALPPRPLDAHKGTCGHALLLAGSRGMAGAAALAAGAALRAGAGLVTAAPDDASLPVLQQLVPCATCLPRDALPQALPAMDALAAGPGLGQDPALGPLLRLLADAPCPQVWDADALNWLAGHPMTLDERFLLTPHPGEAARLLSQPTAHITADPLAAAEALHRRYGAVILLKGATTVIHSAHRRALNTIGTPGMATGGSGDVLTGILAGLLAQGLAPFDAAQTGALLHGLAGQAAAARGIRSMTAWDLMEALRLD